MTLAFYKGKGNFMNRLIRWWTRSKYSHIELMIGDVCYSSANWDGGVRSKKIYFYKDHWDFVDVSASFSENFALLWFRNNDGAKYDYLGLFTFLFDFIKP